MARPKDPNTKYKLKVAQTGKYRYAVTCDPWTNPETGRPTSTTTVWGTVDENLVFTPNSKFLLLPGAGRAKFIFPEQWDLSNASGKIAKTPRPPRARERRRG